MSILSVMNIIISVRASPYPVHSGRWPTPLSATSGAPPWLSTIFRSWVSVCAPTGCSLAISFLFSLLFLLVCVALQLKSRSLLRYHTPRLCRIAVLKSNQRSERRSPSQDWENLSKPQQTKTNLGKPKQTSTNFSTSRQIFDILTKTQNLKSVMQLEKAEW